ncbi:uncharacterized protein LOC126566709 [Anopheles maculipalpis]|uniref:uncharacterized protein LOC126566709 n=1 Tax=Anopheles maculipalpis TaxID=1496333 RepID=UPI0021590B5C|nr:uncharacterized protein LOC126566709 [Anopheles maculipalpis]
MSIECSLGEENMCISSEDEECLDDLNTTVVPRVIVERLQLPRDEKEPASSDTVAALLRQLQSRDEQVAVMQANLDRLTSQIAQLIGELSSTRKELELYRQGTQTVASMHSVEGSSARGYYAAITNEQRTYAEVVGSSSWVRQQRKRGKCGGNERPSQQQQQQQPRQPLSSQEERMMRKPTEMSIECSLGEENMCISSEDEECLDDLNTTVVPRVIVERLQLPRDEKEPASSDTVAALLRQLQSRDEQVAVMQANLDRLTSQIAQLIGELSSTRKELELYRQGTQTVASMHSVEGSSARGYYAAITNEQRTYAEVVGSSSWVRQQRKRGKCGGNERPSQQQQQQQPRQPLSSQEERMTRKPIEMSIECSLGEENMCISSEDEECLDDLNTTVVPRVIVERLQLPRDKKEPASSDTVAALLRQLKSRDEQVAVMQANLDRLTSQIAQLIGELSSTRKELELYRQGTQTVASMQSVEGSSARGYYAAITNEQRTYAEVVGSSSWVRQQRKRGKCGGNARPSQQQQQQQPRQPRLRCCSHFKPIFECLSKAAYYGFKALRTVSVREETLEQHL